MCRDTDYGCTCRDVVRYDGACPNSSIIAYYNATDNNRATTNTHSIP